ncbi:MAG: hypothetical protein JNJ77_20150 [Planctomycetia bacterium]|nr:hypothetical protein [Planctomycetia bacterium]
MALNYTNLFTDIGAIIAEINSYQTMAGTTLPGDRDTLEADLAGFLVCTSRLKPLYDAMQKHFISLRQGLAQIATLRLQDKETVLDELSLISNDTTGLLRALYRQMGLDSESVDRSTVTLGSATYAGANNGNGKVFTSKVLDGYSSPGNGMPACQHYNGADSELCVPSETITMVCTADSEMDGRQEGSESWTIQGGPSFPKLGWQDEGSGSGTFSTFNNQGSLVNNKDFETWSTNTPTGWTLTTGAAGVTKESTTIFRGTYALKFAGNASLLLDLNQAVSPSRLKARQRYMLSLAVKASGVPAAGNLVVKFTGTGYTAASSEKIDIAAGSMPTSWTLYNCFINLPSVLPSDWKLSITVTGPLSNGTNLFLDSICFAPVRWHGGFNFGLVSGSSPWLRGDRITFTVANDAAGTFQEFFRRWFGFQLVSAGGGGETIDDALAA